MAKRYIFEKHNDATGIKTTSFAFVHFSVAFGVAYLLSGSWLVGGMMAAIEPSINTFAYYFHERVWQRRQTPVSIKQATQA